MSKIDIDKVVEKVFEDSSLNPAGDTEWNHDYRLGVRDLLKKLAPFLEMTIENMDFTDVPYCLNSEEVDGTQFHLTFTKEEGEFFRKQYEAAKQFLCDEED